MILIKLALTAALLFALAYAAMFALQLYSEHTVPKPGNTDAIIVLGAQVNPDGQPSKQLALRLQLALEEYQRQPRPIVVCGAQGVNEPASEASVMRDWLVARGVKAQDVQMDEYSFNTKQNIQEATYKLPPGTKDVLIVTSDYPSGMGSPILPEYWIKNHAREALAWGKYYVNKFLPFVPID